MSTLHTLGALPGTEACEDCLRLLAKGDALLLLGDGVHAAQTLHGRADVEVFMLSSDALVRGVTQAPAEITQVDMMQFVQLTERFTRQIAWY